MDKLKILSNLKKLNDEYALEVEKKKVEYDIVTKKYSKLLGDKIKNNNPTLIDLSNKYRPSKLVDIYRELYDNEWTDAYEELNKINTLENEQQSISILLKILMKIYDYCLIESNEMDHNALFALTNDPNVKIKNLPVSVQKFLSDRKISDEVIDKNVELYFGKFINDIKKSSDEIDKFCIQFKNYSKQCFKCCWIMLNNSPRVTFYSYNPGDDIHKYYREYLTCGSDMIYVTWPSLLLYKNGPLLYKGIAEFKKNK